MSIRVTALYLLIAGLSIYAWKDWFKSLCGLILLMAIIEHGDMPTTVLGIQGLNPWNLLFAVIFLAWLASRSREGLTWDMPNHIGVLLILCLAVVLFGVLRAAFDRSHIEDYPLKDLISEELINTIKWVLPGLLLYDGCRTRKRTITALVCLLSLYFLIGAQVVKNMPPETALGDGGWVMKNARSKLDEKVGYHATDLSVLLGGASWGLLAALPIVHRRSQKMMVMAAAGMVAFGQATTGGRAGYVAWGMTGLAMCFLKWRKGLILVPIVLILLPIALPGATARMLQGFEQTDVSGDTFVDENAVTSNRMLIWPHVIGKITESPIVGYGRLAMRRTGLTDFLGTEYNDPFPHPHNMYLETLLDNGALGSLPIVAFWVLAVLYSARLFRHDNRMYSAVGGLALALMLTSLIGGLSGQHWFPLEHTLGIWAAFFLALRVYVEEKRVQTSPMAAHQFSGRQSPWEQQVTSAATQI